uniref:glycosyltransferase n=1 Tax=uncultured Christiangramia sp. TaxID=503836 RepID=UPI002618AA70|nr:glycosyltransferase [uncultured Christiangramia sp.]
MNKKLKIAFLVSRFPSVSETFIVNQICDLIDRGHEVKIFAFEKDENSIRHEKIQAYQLEKHAFYFEKILIPKRRRYLPFIKYIVRNFGKESLHSIFKDFEFQMKGFKALNLNFFYRYFWILKHGYFDIIHSHFGENGIYFANLRRTGFYSRSKFVATFHGYDIQPLLLERYQKKYQKIFRTADLLTVNSIFSKNLLKGITDRNITILPVGLDTRFFRKKNVRKNSIFQITYVGRLVEFKGAHIAIKIIAELKDRGFEDINLNIVGEGETKPKLKKMISELDLRSNIKFYGVLSQMETRDLLDRTDVFILPGIIDQHGRAENQGLVIQEAQAMQVPVLVSDAGGMKYGLQDEISGYVLEIGDIEAFANKIEFLIINDKEKIKMGMAGREFVKKKFDSKYLGDQLLEIYHR